MSNAQTAIKYQVVEKAGNRHNIVGQQLSEEQAVKMIDDLWRSKLAEGEHHDGPSYKRLVPSSTKVDQHFNFVVTHRNGTMSTYFVRIENEFNRRTA